MEDFEDYNSHTEEVLSGLRDAVGNADEQLLRLQRELDLLEKKAQQEDHNFEKQHIQVSESSEMDDEDILKYLEECSQNTIDDSIIASLRSSASLEGAASTKLFKTKPSSSSAHTPKSSTPIKRVLTLRKSKTPSDDESSTMKNTIMDLPKKETLLEERWGCLKRVLSEDRSGGSTARNKLFKQILQATEKKHCPPKWKTDMPGQNMDAVFRVSPLAAPKYKSPYESFIADKENFKEKSNEAKFESQQQNRFLAHAAEENHVDRYFKPIQTRPVSSRSEENNSSPNSQALEEAKTENHRLQKLLEEEKKENDKLTDKVSSLEKDVEELEVKIELKNHEGITGTISDTIDEIQNSQKIRERAMMERLHIAARDRDDAMMRAKAMHLKSLQPDRVCQMEKGDQTIMDLVEKISMADSSKIIERYGNELVERMNNLKNARARITAEEMAAVIRERDNAVAKCHTLRQELQNCVEELNNLKLSRNTSVNTTLKAKVLSTREECDQTQVKLHSAEEEIQMLRIYYSLHKSLTLAQDKDLAEKYNEYMENIKDEAVVRAEQAKQVEMENHQLHEKLGAATHENQRANSENATLKHDFQHLKEKCGKLERLIKVLRKKLVNQTHESSPGPSNIKSHS